jgi:hypothetical protein
MRLQNLTHINARVGNDEDINKCRFVQHAQNHGLVDAVLKS